MALVFLGAMAFQHADLISRAAASALIPARYAAAVQTSAPAPAEMAETQDPVAELYSATGMQFEKIEPLPPAVVDQETLWLARCVYSETKRPQEQELVAWVVRNRVETRYRNRTSYESVVLDPYQFSGFNDGRAKDFYAGLTPHSRARGWQTALRIAYEVRRADSTYRPFPPDTRHFYSEQSLPQPGSPDWADGLTPVLPERDYEIAPHRFRFFADVN